MESALTETMVNRLSSVPDRVGASVCFGTPVERDGHTLIPVARVTFGYGLGFGRGSGANPERTNGSQFAENVGEGEGGGGGGGGSSSPVAVIDISRDDVTVKPVVDPTRLGLAWMTLAAWIGFWLLLTIRTGTREATKRRKFEAEKSRD